MRILITGGSGQLGSELQRIFRNKQCSLGQIHEMYRDAQMIYTDKNTLDITNLKDVQKKIKKVQPDVVINTAAYTQVDQCESNIDLAFRVNTLGPRNLAVACEEIQAKLIHLSTDYVFDGESSMPYSEFDIPHPINIYGKTKYLSEEYVQQLCSRYFIVRTSWLYGMDGKNFVKTILKASREKEALQVVSDQTGTPTNATDLAYHLLQLAVTDEYGIYHCTGNGQCSWYEFAKTILEYAQIHCSVYPVSSKEYISTASRPHYSTLDNLMLRCTIGDKMRDWKEALKDFIEHIS
ncbi:dTDP-4-dehydrorhamnose reductase [Geosporobacter ferrireducens]|uniref:dTDP-4-dehydrorhamnose reductase n=1 Tax=Geosporobacter ferrireducens TaxID=1424294 RepID=UPI00139B6605|nr:dTDP-4-dehydrorhamnose reductase [Geosporobacter ferrireducens]MTI57011.1 dTDP-4-dehydrorhamnose reductase [Geosporobacter ferrireducens]